MKSRWPSPRGVCAAWVALAVIGCDAADDAAADAGSAAGGQSAGGSAAGGANTGGSASGGSAAGGENTGGSASGGSGGEPVPVVGGTCDRQACSLCFESSDCHVVDNPCNDDAACEPRQDEWMACVCLSNGDAEAAAACDARFSAAAPEHAPAIVSCLRDACAGCYAEGTGEVAPAPCAVAQNACSVCVGDHCSDTNFACRQDDACSGSSGGLGSCLCGAQGGEGTVDACFTTFGANGGAAAEAFGACVVEHCTEACQL